MYFLVWNEDYIYSLKQGFYTYTHNEIFVQSETKESDNNKNLSNDAYDE